MVAWFWPAVSAIISGGASAAGSFKGPTAQPGRAEPGGMRKNMEMMRPQASKMLQQMAQMKADADAGGPLTSMQGAPAQAGQATPGQGLQGAMQPSGGAGGAMSVTAPPNNQTIAMQPVNPNAPPGSINPGSGPPANPSGAVSASHVSRPTSASSSGASGSSAASNAAGIASALASLAGNVRGQSANAPGINLETTSGLQPSISARGGQKDIRQLMQLLAQQQGRGGRRRR